MIFIKNHQSIARRKGGQGGILSCESGLFRVYTKKTPGRAVGSSQRLTSDRARDLAGPLATATWSNVAEFRHFGKRTVGLVLTFLASFYGSWRVRVEWYLPLVVLRAAAVCRFSGVAQTSRIVMCGGVLRHCRWRYHTHRSSQRGQSLVGVVVKFDSPGPEPRHWLRLTENEKQNERRTHTHTQSDTFTVTRALILKYEEDAAAEGDSQQTCK